MPITNSKTSVSRSIVDSASLLQALSEPTEDLVRMMAHLEGDILVLGAGGKMGPSLALMARRASDAAGVKRRVVAVSRFTDANEYDNLRSGSVEVIRGDLMDVGFVRSLPDVANVIYMVGMKFGASGALAETWATNAFVAGVVAERFAGSRIVAMSTGNVYGLSPVDAGNGSVETDPPAPIGEYAMSALGRERVFQYFCQKYDAPMAIIRLNYATELRYGILIDLAKQVYHGEAISLDMGYFNVIWQRDASDFIVRSLAYVSSPPRILNVTGMERVSSRQVCERFGELFGTKVRFTGSESSTALLSDASRATALFGAPMMPLEAIMSLTADWIMRGGETWSKPTRFQVRDGKF